MVRNFSESRSLRPFQGALAQGLVAAVPGASDPVDAILRQAQLLVIESGLKQPPFDPRSYASFRRVTAIIERDLQVDGRLLPVGREFIVELRRNRSDARKNFTCAHELAHTFFYESVPTIKHRRNKAGSRFDREEEKLCDIAAAELVMPTSIFRKIANDYAPSSTSLLAIASTFHTSIVSTAIRICDLARWNATFILWGTKERQLRASWSVSPHSGFKYLPPIKPLSAESAIYHTLTTGEPTKEREFLISKDGVRPCVAESIQIKGHVLTVISSSAGQSSQCVRTTSSEQPSLLFDEQCGCYGTGWIQISTNGRVTAYRCRASQHIY